MSTSDQNAQYCAVAVQRIVQRAKRLFADHPPEVQSAALAELVAMSVIRQHPSLRNSMLGLHLKSVFQLIPVVEREIFPDGHPPEWRQ